MIVTINNIINNNITTFIVVIIIIIMSRRCFLSQKLLYFCVLNMCRWRLNRWHWEEGRTLATRTRWLVEWTKSQWLPWYKLLTVEAVSLLRQRQRRQVDKRFYSGDVLHFLLPNNGLLSTPAYSVLWIPDLHPVNNSGTVTVWTVGSWRSSGGSLIRV